MRYVGFFVLVLLVFQVVRFVPFLGHMPLIGLWVSVLVTARLMQYGGQQLLARRRDRVRIEDLSVVDNPFNRGKLGSYLLSRGRARDAQPHLEAAAQGDQDSLEWPYRLGLALLELGRPEEALAPLTRVLERDEEYGYGAALLRRAQARIATGDAAGALEDTELAERNHGESPEGCYRRGVALKQLGWLDEARAAFAAVGPAAANASGTQKKGASGWVWRARLARFG